MTQLTKLDNEDIKEIFSLFFGIPTSKITTTGFSWNIDESSEYLKRKIEEHRNDTSRVPQKV